MVGGGGPRTTASAATPWSVVAPSRQPSSSVGALATRRQTIPTATLNAEVDRIFQGDRSLRSVIVRGDDARVHLLNRGDFFQALTGSLGFGRALFYRRTVGRLIARPSEVFAADTPAAEAALHLLAGRSHHHPDDDVLVRWPDGSLGSLAASRLLAELATTFRAELDRVAVSEARFRALLEHSSDVTLVLDEQANVRYLSPSLRVVTGRDPDERIGRPALGVVHPDDQAELAALFERAMAEPDVALGGRFRMEVAGGGWRWFELVGRNLFDSAVGGVVVNYRDVTDQIDLEHQLRHQALHDPLTGMPNRTMFGERLRLAIERCSPGAMVGVLFCDLDDFKAVNDTLGHQAGDRYLADAAHRLARSVRPGDLLARIGGDEFGVVVEGLYSPADAVLAGERVMAVLAEGDGPLATRASVGLAIGRIGSDPDEIVRRADVAMYAAKGAGKARLRVWEPALDGEVLGPLSLSDELHRAIDGDQLLLHYQPIVGRHGELIGVEALVRWRHPDRGVLPPAEFVPHAEQSRTIVALGRWVLQRACRDLGRFDDRDPRSRLVMSVNLSAVELADPGLPAAVAGTLAAHGLGGERLRLEVTETALVHDLDAAAGTLGRLRQLGVGLTMDDFGTGYSALASLDRLPFDNLKLDKGFVDRLAHEERSDRLIRGVIDLAHGLGLTVTAEGVEEPRQRAALIAMGCDQLQGFLLGRPVPVEAIEDVLGGPHTVSVDGSHPAVDRR